jgi:hypothetical protein
MDGWRVEILRDGIVVGEGRWDGRTVVDCTIAVHPGEPDREAALRERWAGEINAAVDQRSPPLHRW